MFYYDRYALLLMRINASKTELCKNKCVTYNFIIYLIHYIFYMVYEQSCLQTINPGGLKNIK